MEPKIPDVRTPMQRGCFTDLLKGRSREVTDVSAVTTPQSRPHLFAIEGRSSKMVDFSRPATAENPEIVNDGDEVLEGRDPVVDFLTTGLPYEDPDCADTASAEPLSFGHPASLFPTSGFTGYPARVGSFRLSRIFKALLPVIVVGGFCFHDYTGLMAANLAEIRGIERSTEISLDVHAKNRKLAIDSVRDSSSPTWPRTLPSDPANWVRELAAEYALEIDRVEDETVVTQFPLASGARTDLLESHLTIGGTSTSGNFVSFIARLQTGSAGNHVPRLEMEWTDQLINEGVTSRPKVHWTVNMILYGGRKGKVRG